MRTTVTIDPDTEALLKEEMRRTGQSFKAILNRAVRDALRCSPSPRNADLPEVVALFRKPFPAEFRYASFNQLADELDDADTLKELAK